MDRKLDIIHAPFPRPLSPSLKRAMFPHPWSDSSSQWRAMQNYIRDMEHEMDKMFQNYRSERIMGPSVSDSAITGPETSVAGKLSTALAPLPPMPFPPLSQQFESWGMRNPITTEPDGSRKLKVQFDLRQFQPEEIHVKAKDGTVEVHAKHEENSDHGKVYREYHRHFTLPGEVISDNLKCRLKPDGILAIEAPLPAKAEKQREQLIPIQFG